MKVANPGKFSNVRSKKKKKGNSRGWVIVRWRRATRGLIPLFGQFCQRVSFQRCRTILSHPESPWQRQFQLLVTVPQHGHTTWTQLPPSKPLIRMTGIISASRNHYAFISAWFGRNIGFRPAGGWGGVNNASLVSCFFFLQFFILAHAQQLIRSASVASCVCVSDFWLIATNSTWQS